MKIKSIIFLAGLSVLTANTGWAAAAEEGLKTFECASAYRVYPPADPVTDSMPTALRQLGELVATDHKGLPLLSGDTMAAIFRIFSTQVPLTQEVLDRMLGKMEFLASHVRFYTVWTKKEVEMKSNDDVVVGVAGALWDRAEKCLPFSGQATVNAVRNAFQDAHRKAWEDLGLPPFKLRAADMAIAVHLISPHAPLADGYIGDVWGKNSFVPDLQRIRFVAKFAEGALPSRETTAAAQAAAASKAAAHAMLVSYLPKAGGLGGGGAGAGAARRSTALGESAAASAPAPAADDRLGADSAGEVLTASHGTGSSTGSAGTGAQGVTGDA